MNATEEAVKLGSPMFGNMILIGALAGTGDLPLERDLLQTLIAGRSSAERLEKNMLAFDLGRAMTAA